MADDTYDISTNNTLDRREMQCPRCWEYRLREDPRRSAEFSGKRDKLMYATRCTNEACPLNQVDPEDIRKQMPTQSPVHQFITNNGLTVTIALILVVGLFIGGGVLLTGDSGPPAPADVSIGVHDPLTGEPISGVTVIANGTTMTTNANGRVSFAQLPPGEYTVSVRPSLSGNYAAPPPMTVTVTDGTYTVTSSYDGVGRTPDGIGISLPEATSVVLRQTGPTHVANLTFASAYNAKRGVNITLYGARSPTPTQTVTAPNTTNTTFTVSGGVANPALDVTVPVVERRVTKSATYTGVETVSFTGTLAPRDVTLTVTPTDGTYPAVRVDRETVCSSSALAESGGTCRIPARYTTGELLTFELVDGDGASYTLSYTARATAESVQVTINGETTRFTRDDGRVAANGSWTVTATPEALREGQNWVVVHTPYAGGLPTRATATISFERRQPLPKQPKIVVTNSQGERHTRPVPKSALTDGVLVGTYTAQVKSEWFTRGTNTVRVVTANGGPVVFEVRAETSGVAGNTVNSSG